MSISCKTGITGYYSGQAVALGLVLLALHFPAGAQPVARSIGFGQTVQGTLTSTDLVNPANGTRLDTYTFFVSTPGKPYFIQASSPDIPLLSVIARAAPTRSPPLNFAFSARGQTLSYSGVLNQPGLYIIVVNARFLQQPTGRYTLSLLNAPP